MAVAYGSIGTTDWTSLGTSAYTVTITKPTGLAEGDLMAAVGCIGGHTGALVFSTPSGWTQLTNSQQNDKAIIAYYKIADASDVAASNFSLTLADGTSDAGDWICGSIVRITGDSPITSTDLVSNDIATGITPPLASVLIMAGMNGHTTTPTPDSYAITNDNPTWTERAEETEGGSSPDLAFGLATAPRSETTATGTWDITWSASTTDEAVLIAVVEEVSVTVNATPAVATATPVSPVISGDANLSVTPNSTSLTVNAATVTAQQNTVWTNESQPSDATWSNEDLIQ